MHIDQFLEDLRRNGLGDCPVTTSTSVTPPSDGSTTSPAPPNGASTQVIFSSGLIEVERPPVQEPTRLPDSCYDSNGNILFGRPECANNPSAGPPPNPTWTVSTGPLQHNGVPWLGNTNKDICWYWPEEGYHSTEILREKDLPCGKYECRDVGPWLVHGTNESEKAYITCDGKNVNLREPYIGVSSDGKYVFQGEKMLISHVERACENLGAIPCSYSNYWGGKDIIPMAIELDKGMEVVETAVGTAVDAVIDTGVSVVSWLTGGAINFEEQLKDFIKSELSGLGVPTLEGIEESKRFTEESIRYVFKLVFGGDAIPSFDGLICDSKKDELIEATIKALLMEGGTVGETVGDILLGGLNDQLAALIQFGMGRFDSAVISVVSMLPIVGKLIVKEISADLSARVCSMGLQERRKVVDTVQRILGKIIQIMGIILEFDQSGRVGKDKRFMTILITLNLVDMAIHFGAKNFDEVFLNMVGLLQNLWSSFDAHKVATPSQITQLPVLKEYIKIFQEAMKGRWNQIQVVLLEKKKIKYCNG